jgi:hypothetical protein
MLVAFGKLQNQVNGVIGGSTYQGTWNASTNTPNLVSSTGTNGYYYIVSVDGSTNLNGITDWKVGDWAIFNGGAWQKVDNTDAVVSVNGFTGAVSLTTSNITEGTNLYFTNARARAAISLTTSGTSGAATYDNGTGVLNIPNYGSALSGYLPLSGGTLESSGSANTLNINHTSGSGIALNISKNGNGEALTIVKGSGSGNAASITGGITLLSELNLTTKLADAHINSAAAWNNKIGGTIATGQVAFGTAAGVIGGDSGLFWDNVNKRLGVGTSAPDYSLQVNGRLGFIGNIGSNGERLVLSGDNVNILLDGSGVGGTPITHIRMRRGAGTSYALQVGSGGVNSFQIRNDNNTGTIPFFISSNNNVGIGTTTDAGYKLDVNGSGRFGGALTGTSATFSGNVGIGTTSPDNKLDVRNTVSTQIRMGTDGGARPYWNIGRDNVTTGNFVIADETSIKMSITNSGNVLINTTTDAGYKLDVNGTGRFNTSLTVGSGGLTGRLSVRGTTNDSSAFAFEAANSSGNSLLAVRNDGAATFSSSVTSTGYFVSSDITLKSLTAQTFDASKIDAISYKWKTDLQGKTLVGYSAQDVQKYMPDAVNTDSNGKLSVDYIQVLVQKIAHLEQKLKEHGLD